MDMLGRNWEPAKATIIEKKKMILGTDHGSGNPPRYKFVVDVEVPGKPPFRTTMKSPLVTTDQSSLWGNKFIPPAPGQVVSVRADSERRKAKWDRSKEANAAALQGLIAQRQAVTARPQPADRAAQLERLAKLRDQGALTDAEYERARGDVEKS
jgi:putative oligomerization/nucleic acid binding protein